MRARAPFGEEFFGELDGITTQESLGASEREEGESASGARRSERSLSCAWGVDGTIFSAHVVLAARVTVTVMGGVGDATSPSRTHTHALSVGLCPHARSVNGCGPFAHLHLGEAALGELGQAGDGLDRVEVVRVHLEAPGEDVNRFDWLAVGTEDLVVAPLDRFADRDYLNVVALLAPVVADRVKVARVDIVHLLIERFEPHHAPRKLPPPAEGALGHRLLVGPRHLRDQQVEEQHEREDNEGEIERHHDDLR
eukprot:1825686-Prymnesium_polylepis.2